MKNAHAVICIVCHRKFDHEANKLDAPISMVINGKRRAMVSCNIDGPAHSPEEIQASYKERCSELIG